MQIHIPVDEIARQAAERAAFFASKPTMMRRKDIVREFAVSESTISSMIAAGILREGLHFYYPPGCGQPKYDYQAVKAVFQTRDEVKCESASP